MTLVEFPSPIVVARQLLLDKADWTGCSRVASKMPVGTLTPPFIKLTRLPGYRQSLIQRHDRILVECWGGGDVASDRLASRALAVLVDREITFVGASWLYSCVETVGVADFYDNERDMDRYQFEVALTTRGEEVA